MQENLSWKNEAEPSAMYTDRTYLLILVLKYDYILM